MNFKLGPILGIENQYKDGKKELSDRYTVCVLLAKGERIEKDDLLLKLSGEEGTTCTPSVTRLLEHDFYRFAFPVDPQDDSHTRTYSVTCEGKPIKDRHQRDQWQFEVPGKNVVPPKIAYCSCNGDSAEHPSDVAPEEFVMWKRMRREHEHGKFHCLLMGGDQVYADSIWDKVTALQNLKKKIDGSFFRRLRLLFTNSSLKKMTTAAMAAHEITREERKSLNGELAKFYEDLYIDSWANEDMSYMLASVPSVMMWDDHDIFDGWGSHPEELQSSDVFDAIFRAARKYFEIFQIRTDENQTLISPRGPRTAGSTKDPWKHYSMHLTLRSVEIFVLDNRSFRTRHRIMTDCQYEDLQNELDDPANPLFANTDNYKDKILCFVIPVPVAHLNYADIAESVLNLYKKNDFRHTLCDDAIDHWDHNYHEEEQKRLLDLMVDTGRRHNPYYVCIVSGDVHTAGAAKITHNASENSVTQLISSGIAHIPPSKMQGMMLGSVSKTLSVVAGYTLDLKNYGDYEEQTIEQKNFGFLCKPEGTGVNAVLVMEKGIDGGVDMAKRRKKDSDGKDIWAAEDEFVAMRTLNKFENPPKSRVFKIQ